MSKWLYEAEGDIDVESAVSENRRSGGEDNIETTPRIQA
jgi:hypothetical protein